MFPCPGIFSQWSELHHNYLDRSHMALMDSSFAMNLSSIYISLVLFYLHRNSQFVGGAFHEDDLTSDYRSESPKSKSRTDGLHLF